MPSKDFSPKLFIESLIQKWWVLFLAIAIGGALGAGISLVLPARYEAEARISTSVDYTILPELEDYEEDRIINEAGWVMNSDEVLLDVQERAKKQGMRISFEDIKDRFSADRIDDLWALRVADSNQETAATLANIWADASFQYLMTAHKKALEASAIRSMIAGLESCQQDQGEATLALCNSTDRETLREEINALTADLEDALTLSKGLNPASNYAINSYAVVPLSASYHTRGVLAFLGMLLGLISGILMLWFSGKRD